MNGLGNVLFSYPFRVPAYYALILRSLTVLEGLALSADPGYKLLGRAYPYIAQRLLTDPAPQLRRARQHAPPAHASMISCWAGRTPTSAGACRLAPNSGAHQPARALPLAG